MCHSYSLNNKINALHEWCLLIIYNDKQSIFQELLVKDKSVSLHKRNLQTISTEMFKVTKGLALDIFSIVFNTRKKLNYNLCHASHFDVSLLNFVYKETESISFLGPKISDILRYEIKEMKRVEALKKRCYKKWKPKNCPCRLCKYY